MKKYTFYIEGLEVELEIVAENVKKARAVLWNGLTDSQRNSVVSIDWIDSESI